MFADYHPIIYIQILNKLDDNIFKYIQASNREGLFNA